MKFRLSASSDGRGRPLTEILTDWAADNPQIRRVWLFRGRPGQDGPEEVLDIALELHPVPDSEETLLVWTANCGKWRRQLAARMGGPVSLDWLDPDGGTRPGQAGVDEIKSLVYERAAA
jgi:hypothetical protein